MVNKHIRIISIICAALNMLFWAFLSVDSIIAWINSEPFLQLLIISAMPSFYLLLLVTTAGLLGVSAAGLLGSLIFRKKPMAGSVMMLISGGLLFLFVLASCFFASGRWWLCIAPLLLTAAGALALIFRKTLLHKELPIENPDNAS